MSANSWSVVMMAMVRALVANGIEYVDNATLQALAASDQFIGLCYNPDAIKANVGANFYDETPFGTFPTLFLSSGKGYKPLPESDWVFRTSGRGRGRSATPDASILAKLAPKPKAEETETVSA